MDDSELERAGNAIGDSITRIVEIAIKARGGWPLAIPVSERLPLEQGEFLCFARKQKDSVQKWRVGFFIPHDGWKCSVSDYTLRDVSHWIPLPPAPMPSAG